MILTNNVISMSDTSFLSLNLKKQQLPQEKKEKQKNDKNFQELLNQANTETPTISDLDEVVKDSSYDYVVDNMPSMQTNVGLKIKHR